MRVTVDEIAKIANVSKATVSRVLNNSPKGVSDETRKRVQKIIKDMNYELRGREPSMWTRTIALVIPDITNPFFSELAKEVENSASDNNYYVVLVNTEFSEERECEYLIRLLTKKIDGIILVPSGSVVRQEHLLPQKYNIPLLLLDRKLRGEHSFVGVYTDSEYAAFKSCELMIKNGSREIAFIGGTPNASTSIERLNGYKAAMTHFNINYNINLIRQGNYTVESGYDAVMELAKQNIRFSAILAANDLMALGAMTAVKEFGYRVPEDVEIMGYDNIILSKYCDPALSTCQQPTIDMGRRAVGNILKMIKGEKNIENVTLQPQLIKRKTTR